MEQRNLAKLHLDSLESGIPALPRYKAGQRMEACVWCLLSSKHENGVILSVIEQENKSAYKICWTEDKIDRQTLSLGYNEDDGPEHGAEAIALLLVRERTDYTAIKRSVTSTGIDYWLGYKNQLFSSTCARLEVSGVLKQSSTNNPKYRTNKKIKQTKRSDYTSFPAYIIIVEFSQPIATILLRHVHN